MTIMLGLFRKQPTPTLVISRPILQHTGSFDSYSQEEEKDVVLSRSEPPPPHHRVLIFTYTTVALLSLTAVILFSVAIPLWNKNFIHRQSPIKTDWPDTLILIPLLLSMISSTHLLVTSLRPRHQSHAPDPCNLVILSSTLLLSLTPTLIIVSNNTLAHAFSVANSQPTSLIPTGTGPVCNMTNILTRACLPVLYLIGELQVGGIVLSSLVGLAWLLLLTLSIRNFMNKRAEERRRKEERRRRRHARRRGHEHQHRNRREHSRRNGSHGPRRRDPASSTAAHDKAETEGLSGGGQSRTKVTLPAPWEGSNAVQYAQQKIKPKESIQMWLADRQV